MNYQCITLPLYKFQAQEPRARPEGSQHSWYFASFEICKSQKKTSRKTLEKNSPVLSELHLQSPGLHGSAALPATAVMQAMFLSSANMSVRLL